jgi:hypothetical protein
MHKVTERANGTERTFSAVRCVNPPGCAKEGTSGLGNSLHRFLISTTTAVKPAQGLVSVPWSDKAMFGCPAYSDLAFMPLTRSIAACAPSTNPWTTAFSFGIARTTKTVGKTIP